MGLGLELGWGWAGVGAGTGMGGPGAVAITRARVGRVGGRARGTALRESSQTDHLCLLYSNGKER